MENNDTDFIGVIIIVVIVFCVIGAFVMVYDSGFEAGVKATHHGEYTVTTLPDGSEAVTKSKKE